MAILRSPDKRLGQVGNTCGKWDNGFYTRGFIQDIPLDVLIDNGSTTTILSNHMFIQMMHRKKDLELQHAECTLYDVNGNPLQLHGKLTCILTLGSADYRLNCLICNISQDAILGQDFLLQYVSKIDYKKQILTTEFGNIQCWIGGEAEMVCRVLSKNTITIAAKSRMFIPVSIQSSEHLADLGLVDEISEQGKDGEFYITRGILESHNTALHVQVVNFKDRPVTIHAKQHITSCESYYEQDIPTTQRCNTITVKPELEPGMIPIHVKDLFDKCSEHLQDREKQQLAELLTKYQDVFSKSADDLGRTDRVQHRISTDNANPIRHPPRRLPLGKRDIEKIEIEKMLKRGVIEPSKSPWCSPVVLVTKKDGTTRFCVDYRALNNAMIKDAYPLPRVDECLDSLAGGKWFSCLDLCSGFWQVRLHPQDKEKTAFSTTQGLFHFTATPFDLANSPSTFVRLIEDVLRGLQ